MSEERLSALLTSFSVLVSAGVLAVLLTVDVALLGKMKANSVAGTIVPAAGSLLGLKASDGSEWRPISGEGHAGLLFGIAEEGELGDIEYWLDVAARARASVDDLQFVGLCLSGDCESPSGSDSVISILQFMDPQQTHALASAARQGTAFFFLGKNVLGPLPADTDRERFAEGIVHIFRQRTSAGGL